MLAVSSLITGVAESQYRIENKWQKNQPGNKTAEFTHFFKNLPKRHNHNNNNCQPDQSTHLLLISV